MMLDTGIYRHRWIHTLIALNVPDLVNKIKRRAHTHNTTPVLVLIHTHIDPYI